MLERDTVVDVGERIRRLRMERHMSVRQLADKSGVSASQTSAIERGRRTSVETIVRLARALEVDASTLVQDADLMAERRVAYESRTLHEAGDRPLPLGLQELVDDASLASSLDVDLITALATLSLSGDRRLSKRQYFALHLLLQEFLRGELER